MKLPAESEYAPFYAGYIAQIDDGSDILATLAGQEEMMRALGARVDEEREGFRYAPGKWSIREVVGHLCDAERVFTHRAFCIGRGETASLPGFDENEYLRQGCYEIRSLSDLVDELVMLRRVTLSTFAPLSEVQWKRVGTANGSRVSVRALAWIIAGHFHHHMGVLRDRYEVDVRGE